jgi:hypothetical protein
MEVALANPAELAIAAFAASGANAANAAIAAESSRSFFLAYVYTLEVSRQSGSY